MKSQIVIPKLGATGADIEIVEWYAQEGQAVKSGEVLLLVTTDKASVEIEAFRDGFVRQIIAPAGSMVEPGATIGWLSDSMDEPLASEPPAPAMPKQELSDRPGVPDPGESQPAERSASPLARRVASNLGIALANVKATSPNGKIYKRDVIAAAQARSEGAASSDERGSASYSISEKRPLTASRLASGEQAVSHLYLSVEVDVTRAEELQAQLAEMAKERMCSEPSVLHLLIKACGLALRAVPSMLVHLNGQEFIAAATADIGIIRVVNEDVATSIVRSADQSNIFELAAQTEAFKTSGETAGISPMERDGAAITIFDLGMFDLDGFLAAITPPHSAILAVGAIRTKPVWRSGSVSPRQLMQLTLSVDHRVAESTDAARFLGKIKQFLERPAVLVVGTKGGAVS